MLHVHVLLVAPLGAGHMAQPGTDQHEGGVAVREAPHHASAAADFPVQSLNYISTSGGNSYRDTAIPPEMQSKPENWMEEGTGGDVPYQGEFHDKQEEWEGIQ